MSEKPSAATPSNGQQPTFDPFCASDADISRAVPNVVFHWSDASGGVSAKLERSAFRKRSKIVKAIESCPGVVFLPSRKEHAVPAHELSTVIRRFKEKEITFAVHAEAAAYLQPSAPLRRRLLEEGDVHSVEDLTAAYLSPRIVPCADGFQVEGLLAPHLKAMFADIESFGARKAKASYFSALELPWVLHRARSAGIRLFLSVEAAEALRSQARTLHSGDAQETGSRALGEESILLAQPESAFVVSEGAGGLFLLRTDVMVKHQGLLQTLLKLRIKDSTSSAFPGYAEWKIPDSVLPEFFAATMPHLSVPVVSDRFRALQAACQLRFDKVCKNREYAELPDTPLESSEYPELVGKLFPHQRVAVRWLLENPRGFLGDDMGLGKTISVLATYAILKERGEIDRLLVICPNSLTRNWKREAEAWLPSCTVVLPGNEKRLRESTLRSISWGARRTDILVLNYESIRIESVVKAVSTVASHARTMICLDESQRVKNHSTKLFQALRGIIPECSRRVLLSGTPTPQQFADIWAQMLLLDDGERFGTNFYKWLETVAVLGTKYSDFAVKQYKELEVEEGRKRVQELLLRRRKEDVVDLPEKTFSVRDIELAGEQKSRFDEMREGLLLRISSCDGDIFFKKISSILEEYLRAVQLASNPRLIDPEWKGEPAKFVELDEIVEEVVQGRGEKIVIWTNFVQNVRELVTRYERFGAAPYYGDVTPQEREKIVQNFQHQASPRVLVAVPAAGGVGITLTAAQTAVYVDKTWNAEHYLQSIDRLHRIGQTGTVNIISLHACKIDQLIARSLRRKAEQQAHLLGDNDKKDFALTATEYLLPSRQELIEAVSE